MKNNILMVGGGTGGHFVPIFALYKRIKEMQPSQKVIVVGQGGPLEAKYFAGIKDYMVLRTGKIHRTFTLKNIWQLLLLLWGVGSAFFLLQKIKPKIIFSKGGFVSLPIVFWARLLNIPYFVHESDAIIGLTNRLSANGAKKVFVGFPSENYNIAPSDKVVFTGQITDKVANLHKKYDFGLTNDKPTILVTGGSQGAKIINRFIFKSLPELLKHCNVIHQVGSLDYQLAIDVRSQLDSNLRRSYFVTDFLGQCNGINLMATAIDRADVVISRASATTIAEIASFSKPMILIPYRYSSAGHQKKNAEILKKADACLVILEENLNAKHLLLVLTKLLDDPKKMHALGTQARSFFPQNGVDAIVKELLKEVS